MSLKHHLLTTLHATLGSPSRWGAHAALTIPKRAWPLGRSILVGFLLVGVITSCRQPTTATEHPTHTGRSASGTAKVRIVIVGLDSPNLSPEKTPQSRISSMPELSIQAAAITVYVEGPKMTAYSAPIPITSGEGTLTLPAGSDRTLSIDVDNQWGLLIFQSPSYKLHLPAGTTTTLPVRLEPVETIIPLATAIRVSPDRPTTLTVLPDESLVQDLRLSIPAHAVRQTTSIRAEEVYNPEDVPRPVQQASTIVGLQPHHLTLERPATLAFPYYPLLISRLGLSETHLQLNYFHPDQQIWRPLPNQTLQMDESLVLAEIEQFGLYTLTVGPASQPETPPPAPFSETQRTTQTVAQQPNPRPAHVQIKPPATIQPSPRQPVPAQQDWSNYRVSLILNANTPTPLGIVFRYQNRQTYYKLIWNSQLRSARLTKHDQGDQTILAHQTLPLFPRPDYQLDLTAIADTFHIRINNNTVLTARDSQFRTGSVALSCYGEEETCFKNARIEDK